MKVEFSISLSLGLQEISARTSTLEIISDGFTIAAGIPFGISINLGSFDDT